MEANVHQVFVLSSEMKCYLYATFSLRLTPLNVNEADAIAEKTHIYNKNGLLMTELCDSFSFFSVITQQCVHIVGQSFLFNNIMAATPCSRVFVHKYVHKASTPSQSVLTKSVFPRSCLGICCFVFS